MTRNGFGVLACIGLLTLAFAPSPASGQTAPSLGSAQSFAVLADASGCFGEHPYAITIITQVPTLPQMFMALLGVGLTAVGYFRLRRRARAR